MRSINKIPDALFAFQMAHRFMYDYNIRWLPVDPYEIIYKTPKWKLKYTHQLAYELGVSVEYVETHIMRSKDGLAMYDIAKDQYDIIISNNADMTDGRIRWTVVHEIGHIYLNHLQDLKKTAITTEYLTQEEYDNLEFEADIFAGEVLASKWLMRYIDIVNEEDISLLCRLSDKGAQSRYKKATENYSFIPANAAYTISRFSEYLKEVAVCQEYSWFEFPKFLTQNTPKPLLAKPKPSFAKVRNACRFCGNEFGVTERSNFCIACGSPIKPNSNTIPSPCGHVNIKEAAFCEICGGRVFRIRQGFCFEECECI